MLGLGNINRSVVRLSLARNVHTSAALFLLSKKPKVNTLESQMRGGASQPSNTSLDFRNTKDAYLSKRSKDIFRAYGVFKFCSYDTMMKYQKQLLNVSRKVLGRSLFEKAMRMSIYGQFMAGDERDEILKSAQEHHKFGVRPMFAYTASESHGHAKGMLGSALGEKDLIDVNFDAMNKCIEIAALSPREAGEFIKITGKLTYLARSEIYRTATKLIDENTKLVQLAGERSGGDVKWKAVLSCLQKMVTSQDEGSMTHIARNYQLPLPSTNRDLNWDSVTTCWAFHLAASKSQVLGTLLKDLSIQPYVLSEENENELLQAFARLNQLSKKSDEYDICLVLDAEQTYLQSAMDVTALDLMRIHNKHRPVVHNTYQCYLRRTYDVITRDLASAEAEGFQLGAKVVRGGYMDEERRLAVEHNYPDPVNPTFEATTAMYFKVAEELVQQIIKGTKLQITFATHNEDTVKHIIHLMDAYDISPDRNVLSFAQLLGMRDHVAFILGRAGIPANKLLHYGPVEDCVAYLSRRITENKSGVPTANVERDMLSSEIKRRWRAKELFR